jgi:hypothetical protein
MKGFLLFATARSSRESPRSVAAAGAARGSFDDCARRNLAPSSLERKVMVEPVFGQIKQAMGFRRFSLRGLAKAAAEWAIVCLCHNLLKQHRVLWASTTAN